MQKYINIRKKEKKSKEKLHKPTFFATFAEKMRYQQLWRSLLTAYQEGEARAVARTLIEDKYGLSLADVMCEDIETLAQANSQGTMTCESVRNSLADDIQRLTRHEPVQYVTRRAWFADRCFAVRPGCLIPRQETEELCQWIEEQNKAIYDDGHTPCILDIGTGSGCIAITLALDIPQAKVEAWDISDEALAIASDNAESLHADVRMRRQDALMPPQDDRTLWDVIVSNPPYIRRMEMEEMEPNVTKYEPHLALFVDDTDPIVFYRHIAMYASHALKRGGWLYFEINPECHTAMKEMLLHHGFMNIETRQDQWGKKRMMRAQRGLTNLTPEK